MFSFSDIGVKFFAESSSRLSLDRTVETRGAFAVSFLLQPTFPEHAPSSSRDKTDPACRVGEEPNTACKFKFRTIATGSWTRTCFEIILFAISFARHLLFPKSRSHGADTRFTSPVKVKFVRIFISILT